MPATVGKLPRGLVSLLSLRDSGEAPRLLADSIVGTVDFSELFLLQDREIITTAVQPNPIVGANFFPAPIDLVVPPGQLWYIWNYVCACTTGAGETMDLAPSVNLDGLPLSAPVGDYAACIANQQVRVYSRSGFWAGPGSQFGFVVRSLTLQPDVSAALVISRLRI